MQHYIKYQNKSQQKINLVGIKYGIIVLNSHRQQAE